MTEDEMVGWHHQFNGHEFDPTLGDSEEQGSLVCCSPWGLKEYDMTERLSNNNSKFKNKRMKKVYNSNNNPKKDGEMGNNDFLK